MIFVTVGTHEQPFDRLVEYMDNWAGNNKEEVIIQTGFAKYKPIHCKWRDFYPYAVMKEMVSDARIVITHGGPSSFIMPLQMGKTPIVMPRMKQFNEHVNDHQVSFSHAVADRQKNIIVVDNTMELGEAIKNYNDIILEKKNDLTSNNKQFCYDLEQLIWKMVEDGEK